MQANLQRSKLATAVLYKMSIEKGISVALVQEPYVGRTGEMRSQPGTTTIQYSLNYQKSVKAAIIVFGNGLEVIHDSQIITENVAAVHVIAGPLSCDQNLHQNSHLPPHSGRRRERLESLVGQQFRKPPRSSGKTPTFETYRGGRLYESCVEFTPY